MKKIFFTFLILTVIGCNNSQTNTSENSQAKFEWDFSQPKKVVYDFSQETVHKSRSSREQDYKESYLEAKGNLNVRINDNETAELSLTEMKMKSVSADFHGNLRDTTSRDLPPNVIQGMKSNGSFGDSKTDIIFKILFPLPKPDLKKGDSDKLPLQMPFNPQGSRLLAEGFNTLTFEGYETLEGRRCAVLKGDIDISKLDVPDELRGEYELSVKGIATYYFDADNQIYVGSDIKLVMSAVMIAETDNKDDYVVYMDDINDNVFRIRLKTIEE